MLELKKHRSFGQFGALVRNDNVRRLDLNGAVTAKDIGMPLARNDVRNVEVFRRAVVKVESIDRIDLDTVELFLITDIVLARDGIRTEKELINVNIS